MGTWAGRRLPCWPWHMQPAVHRARAAPEPVSPRRRMGARRPAQRRAVLGTAHRAARTEPSRSAPPRRAGGHPAGRRARARPGAGARGRPERAARAADGHLPAGGHRPGGAGASRPDCRVKVGEVGLRIGLRKSPNDCCVLQPRRRAVYSSAGPPCLPGGRAGRPRSDPRAAPCPRGALPRARSAPRGSHRAPVCPPRAALRTASAQCRRSRTAAARSRVPARSPWARARGRRGAPRPARRRAPRSCRRRSSTRSPTCSPAARSTT